MQDKTKHNKIKTYRSKINIVDKKISKLLDKRYEHANKIWQLKSELHLDIKDKDRESIILNKLATLKLHSIDNKTIVNIYQQIISEFINSKR